MEEAFCRGLLYSQEEWGPRRVPGYTAVTPCREARVLDTGVSCFRCLSLTLKPSGTLRVPVNDAKRNYSQISSAKCLFSTKVTIIPASNQREPNLPSEPWEPRVTLLLMSFYFNLTLGEMCFNSPKSMGRVWIKYTVTAVPPEK